MPKMIEVGKIYRCAASPSGYLMVEVVDSEAQTASGWADQYAFVMSGWYTVAWSKLRRTNRRGPFGASKERTLDPAQRRSRST